VAGSIVATPFPATIDIKPGSATVRFFGIEAAILEVNIYFNHFLYLLGGRVCLQRLEVTKNNFRMGQILP